MVNNDENAFFTTITHDGVSGRVDSFVFFSREIRNGTKQVTVLPGFDRFAKLKKDENTKKVF